MINLKDKLTILHDDNGTFIDHTASLCDYLRDTSTITLATSEDYLYIGFYKPISAVYIEFETPNTVSATLSLEYYKKTAEWTSITHHDDTKGLTRSAFLSWERNQTDQIVNTINSQEKFWYRISADATTSAMIIKGINIVFSDDQELKRHYDQILSTDMLGSLSSHINIHVAARDYILQRLRNNNNNKLTSGDVAYITPWDLLDIEEVRMAATFKALSMIFNNLSDGDDDFWANKSLFYDKEYYKMINNVNLSIDSDDDGLKDPNENMAKKGSIIYFTR